VKVAFLVNDLQLSGGIGVVVAHARQLHDHHGFDVSLVLAREQEDPHWQHEPLIGLPVVSLVDARSQHYDIVMSTWWETAFALFELRAERYVSFVQSLEDRFYLPGHAERLGARLVLDLPVSFITEARWIADTLADLRPDAPCYLVRNGIDKDVFASPPRLEPRIGAPLRVLVEGYANVWFKGVNDAVAAVGQMHEPHHLTVVAPNRDGLVADAADRVIGPVAQRELAALYAESDVLVKLSRVEGMYGPPLEAFHMGATCVTTEVTGHEEYIEHGVNALVCDWDDLRGTARQLDLLSRDRVLLHELRLGALQTAAHWPTWEQSGQFMAGALRAIRRDPPPAAPPALALLMADVRVEIEEHRQLTAERDGLWRNLERYERLTRLPGVRNVLALRGRRSVQILLRCARPLTRPVKRKLLGP
jgi:glycosyltransferase involved in cell wall biosynthesis